MHLPLRHIYSNVIQFPRDNRKRLTSKPYSCSRWTSDAGMNDGGSSPNFMRSPISWKNTTQTIKNIRRITNRLRIANFIHKIGFWEQRRERQRRRSQSHWLAVFAFCWRDERRQSFGDVVVLRFERYKLVVIFRKVRVCF